MVGDKTQFLATVAKVQTLADGGLRFTLDAGEGEILAAAEMMAYKRHGVVLEINAAKYEKLSAETLINNEETVENAVQERTEWES